LSVLPIDPFLGDGSSGKLDLGLLAESLFSFGICGKDFVDPVSDGWLFDRSDIDVGLEGTGVPLET
jgi:hypothetical protein